MDNQESCDLKTISDRTPSMNNNRNLQHLHLIYRECTLKKHTLYHPHTTTSIEQYLVENFSDNLNGIDSPVSDVLLRSVPLEGNRHRGEL